MCDTNRGSAIHDPLEGYFGLSLFPRTSKSSTIQDLFNSQLQSQNELQEPGMVDVASNSELPTTALSCIESEEDYEDTDAKIMANPRGRRPGLGLKRKARFSIKSNTSLSTATAEPTFDPEKYQKPEDFFSAFENFENAKREWHKQMGVACAETDYNQRRRRPHRPGIPRKNPVKYRHLYSTEESKLQGDVLSSTFDSSQQEASEVPFTVSDKDRDGSITGTEERVNDILDDLLVSNHEDLDGDHARHLLEERLQIKPLVVEKLYLPGFEDIQRPGVSKQTPSKRRVVLSDLQNVLNGNKTERTNKSIQRSPLASVSLLRKQRLLSNSKRDYFSFHETGHSSPEGLMSPRASGKLGKADKNLGLSPRLLSFTSQGNDTDATIVGDDNAAVPSDKSVTDCANEEGFYNMHSRRSRSHSVLEVNNGEKLPDDEITDRDSRQEMASEVIADEKNQLNYREDEMLQSREAGVQLECSVLNSSLQKSFDNPNQTGDQAYTENQSNCAEGVAYEGSIAVNNALPKSNDIIRQSDGTHLLGTEAITENQLNSAVTGVRQDFYVVDTMFENANDIPTLPDLSRAEAQTETQSLNSGCQVQVNEDSLECNRKQVKKPRNPRSHADKGREAMAFSRRKSLSAAGTSWKCGIRRSTRIRSRPLEYWKGERFLYGRIHESLATVIGIKYESPTKDEGTTGLKVKSFVSDDFKKLVEFAARH